MYIYELNFNSWSYLKKLKVFKKVAKIATSYTIDTLQDFSDQNFSEHILIFELK